MERVRQVTLAGTGTWGWSVQHPALSVTILRLRGCERSALSSRAGVNVLTASSVRRTYPGTASRLDARVLDSWPSTSPAPRASSWRIPFGVNWTDEQRFAVEATLIARCPGVVNRNGGRAAGPAEAGYVRAVSAEIEAAAYLRDASRGGRQTIRVTSRWTDDETVVYVHGRRYTSGWRPPRAGASLQTASSTDVSAPGPGATHGG